MYRTSYKLNDIFEKIEFYPRVPATVKLQGMYVLIKELEFIGYNSPFLLKNKV